MVNVAVSEGSFGVADVLVARADTASHLDLKDAAAAQERTRSVFCSTAAFQRCQSDC